MAKFMKAVDSWNEKQGDTYLFQCPGCDCSHRIATTLGKRINGPTWTFNGDLDKPTISPSLRVRWNYGEDQKPQVCHSFIKDGMIQYLGDCTHHLKGQTVELPEWIMKSRCDVTVIGEEK
jgi:hypothetical protein